MRHRQLDLKNPAPFATAKGLREIRLIRLIGLIRPLHFAFPEGKPKKPPFQLEPVCLRAYFGGRLLNYD